MRKDLREEHLDRGSDAENSEYDEQFPCDVGDARGHEEAEGEVEQPVADGGDRLHKSIY